MRSPVVAMLWENWRLTRVEAAQRLALAFVGGAVLTTFAGGSPDGGHGALNALFLGVLINATLWLSVAKLNGGRFLDGYHPGFPLHLLYTRPVRTAALVGVPMAYAAASAAALYLVWALLMRMTFGHPFPLVPVAAWIGTLQLVQAAAYWATRSKLVQWVGSTVAFGACAVLALRRVGGGAPVAPRLLPDQWPLLFDYSLADYALIVAIGLAAFGLTVAGVARQRRGDAGARKPRTAGWAGPPDWLVGLFRFPCPTASATRAQVWFDLKSSGLGVLAIGSVFAIAIPLLYAVSGPVASVRPFALLAAGLAVLLAGGNAFGIRRKQGHAYAGAFDATQAYGTASLAGLKVLVRTLCVLAALGVVGLSVWASLALVSGWPNVGREAAALQEGRGAIEAAFSALSAYQQAALAVVVFIEVGVIVSARAALEALFARYRRRLIIAGALLLLYGLAFALSALMPQGGGRLETLADTLFGATPWMAAVAIALATAYLFWRAVAERLLTPRQTWGAVLISAVFGVAWVTMLHAAGIELAGMSVTDAVWALSPMLLPLTASVLAPWSLSRVRHT